MPRMLMMLSLAVLCTACQQADTDSPAATSGGEPAVPVHVTPAIAYEHACADCHETGKDNAPRTGDPDAWAGRSALWEAVLFEHAQKGYFDMPAHGLDGVGHRRLGPLRNLRRDGCCRLRLEFSNDDLHAVARETPAQRTADPVAAPRDNGCFDTGSHSFLAAVVGRFRNCAAWKGGNILYAKEVVQCRAC